MLNDKQFASTRLAPIHAATFWRANASTDLIGEESRSFLAFDPLGRIGILGVPIETGLLSVILCGEENEDHARGVLPGVLDGLINLLSTHHEVGRDDLTWLYVGGENSCAVNLAIPVRSLTSRIVSVRTRLLKTGIGSGGDLKDVAMVYGMDAAMLLRSAMLHFPRMKGLCRSLPPRKRVSRTALAC